MTTPEAEQVRCCALPYVAPLEIEGEASAERTRAIFQSGKLWVNYTNITYHLATRTSVRNVSVKAMQEVVRQAFRVWKALGIGLTFEEVSRPARSMLRITFQGGIGSFSYVGTDNLRFPSGQTMNFGWDLTTRYGFTTALHEIGHALGFEHEHQNPLAGLVWNEQKVIDYFGGPPNNWAPDQVRFNIIDKIDTSLVVGSGFDEKSVMCYSFPPGLALQPESVRLNGIGVNYDISGLDKEEILKRYAAAPSGAEATVVPLIPFKSAVLDVENGGQRDFSLSVDTTRTYTIRTIGRNVDTILVLQEKDSSNGNLITLAGSNDSGKKTTASLEVRLVSDRTYILRARLVYSAIRAEVAVLCY